MSKQTNKLENVDRAKISLPIETSIWLRDLQANHTRIRKIELSLSQIVSRGMEMARKELTTELTRK